MFVVQVLAIAFLQLYFVEEIAGVIGVTLSVFSGVPDPHWVMEPTQEFQDLYKKAQKANALYQVDAMPSRLGYRGFIIQEESTEVLILGSETTQFQLALLRSMPEGKIPAKVKNRVYVTIVAASVLPVKAVKSVKERKKRYVPAYDAGYWASPRKETNNCYNYANIKATNTFAQPGRGTNNMYRAITKARILAGSISDGLLVTGNGNTPPRSRHVVALVVEDCVDFHWYLKNSDNTWSHKPGRTAVTQLDNAGQVINNPQNCAMNGYEFVTYMTTDRNTVQIR